MRKPSKVVKEVLSSAEPIATKLKFKLGVAGVSVEPAFWSQDGSYVRVELEFYTTTDYRIAKAGMYTKDFGKTWEVGDVTHVVRISELQNMINTTD